MVVVLPELKLLSRIYMFKKYQILFAFILICFSIVRADGVKIEKWPNGKKKSESQIKGGKANGKVSEWYENGNKKSECDYKDGEKHGKLITWYENGMKKDECEFKDG